MDVRRIDSPANPLVKEIRKLRQRKYRLLENAFFVEGLRIVCEALRTGQEMRHVLVCPELLNSDYGRNLVEKAAVTGISVIETSADVFLSLAEKEHPQGIAAVIAARTADLDVLRENPGVWVGLVDVQDPGNLGSILRSADASGARGVLLLGQTTDPWHPTAARASTGALFTQIIVQADLDELAAYLQGHPMHLIGTLSQDAHSFREYNYPREMILLLGSEQKGLPEEYAALCDGLVHIPMKGSVDSLNLAGAASIILFEIIHQHNGTHQT